MGITSAMFSGVSGLNTNSQAMSVIGNNLANTNTLGFKGARSVFSDLLSSNVFSSGGGSQVGRGVGLSIIDNVFSQGTFETTTSDTDVAVEGEGFFVVSAQGDDTNYFTRAGAFRFNRDGYLVNPQGYIVQGKQFDDTGELEVGDPSDIQVANLGLIAGNASENITFNTNLDAQTNQIDLTANPNIVVADRATYNYSGSSQIYDSLGESHLITVYWRMTDATANTWQIGYTIDGVGEVDGAGNPTGNALWFNGGALDTLSFDERGQIDTNNDNNFADNNGNGVFDEGVDEYLGADAPLALTITNLNFNNGSELQDITINFDCTQFDSESIVIGTNQDGYGAGELTNIAIAEDGIVVASYSNGEQKNIAQLVLAKFQNAGGLALAGSNLYKETNTSGTVRIGLAGAELGTIYTNSLEQSNVDMGQEFVKMITTQRGFQANSKIISTVDEMLSELINLKR
ncbi:MAG: flagellar hook-basal body protein [Desulfobulbus propionicus]|nr:MAG: flagellar hook-basal body protein [Desulfobulbus propionicus]PIE65841.1 MAG: flagellar hook-basal body protein [Desulfobacterales bacterium]